MPPAVHRLRATEPLLTYRGAVSLQEIDGGVAPWRVPHEERRLYFPEGGMGRAAMPSGVRLTFRTAAAWVRCHYTARPAPEVIGPPEVGQVDVVADGMLVASIPVRTDGQVNEFVAALPGGDRRIELWLPCLNQFVVHGVEIPGAAEIGQDMAAEPRWTHFGSSESQGRGAESPSRNWLAIVARARALDLTSLAMGAGCHLQPMYGRLMRDLPAELITMCVGLNIYGVQSLNEFSLRANLIGLVRTVREKQSDTPIVVMTPYYSPRHDPLRDQDCLSLREIRAHIREAVELLRQHGDRNVHYLHGPDVLGIEASDLFIEPPEDDPIHLTGAGHRTLAAAFQRGLDALSAVPKAAGSLAHQ